MGELTDIILMVKYMHLDGCCVQQDPPFPEETAERRIMEHESSDASSGIKTAQDSTALSQANNR